MKSSRVERSTLIAAVMTVCLTVSMVGAAGLDGPVSIIYDSNRVPTIVAETEHDVIYMQGYQHAQDRFFQMDFQRKAFAGRVSELVGSAGLPSDVQVRTLGLARAAAAGLAVQTPEVTEWLEAYADGVNAYLADASIPLPLEYSLLEIDRSGIEPWEPLHSLIVAKGLAFNLSFDLGDTDRTLAILNYRGVGDALGFNGLQLFNNDLWPTAPFDPTISIPGALPSSVPGELNSEAGCGAEIYQPVDFVQQCPSSAPASPVVPMAYEDEEFPTYMDEPSFKTMVQEYRDIVADIPMLAKTLEQATTADAGSNWWVVDGSKTDSGFPMIASDPHLALSSPSTFYECHLNVTGGINVTGVSFPGAPGLVLGCNDTICWGATVNSLDVTDVFNEVLFANDPGNPTLPTHSLFEGVQDPLAFIPQQFFVNIIGDTVPNNTVDAGVPADQGGLTLIVPRRDNGPIVQTTLDLSSPTPLTGLSIQWTGFSATQELEAFRQFARATTMQEFKDGLQFFDVGSQNWGYADINGNIAYYTSAELPLRQDLQTILFPAGLQPPYLIRDGTNTNPHAWLPATTTEPGQAISSAILPFAEMPQVENPPQGYILNANNDPIGTTLDNISWNQFRAGFNGVLYLAPGYATGFRMGRIQQLFDDVLASGGTLSQTESIQIQANGQLLDAEVLTPYIIDAYNNASAPGAPPQLAAMLADPRVADAVSRLAAWDFSTPTGIQAGFDPFDNPAALPVPTQAEIDNSIAATIYSIWRGQIIQRTIDTTLASLPVPLDAYAPGSSQSMVALRQLLDDYSTNGGNGASLLNFFTVPGEPDQFIARDIILLGELLDGLNLLASPAFAAAFGESTDLNDYRWGYLHRIVFASNLDDALSVPPPGSPSNLSPDLRGFSRHGGFGAVDASSHSARADGVNEFMFSSGSSRRLFATMAPTGPEPLQVIPGGESGLPGHPNQADQLPLWLTNIAKPLPVDLATVQALAIETLSFACGDGITGPGEECDDGNTFSNDGCSATCTLDVVLPVPTVSEWGLLLMSLLLLTVGSIVFSGMASMANNNGSAGSRSFGGFTAPPFSMGLLTRVFLATLALIFVGFMIALAVFGTVTRVDITGSLLAAPVFAYLAHLWILMRTRP